jgi:protein required for attachment to host cells
MAHSTWVVAADGRSARVYQERKRGGALEEVERLDMNAVEEAVMHPRDRAPRSYESSGSARHAMEPTDTPVQDAEKRFLHRVAERLAEAKAAAAFERVVLFAPPRALGALRAALKAPVLAAIEFASDSDAMDDDASAIRVRLRDLRLP